MGSDGQPGSERQDGSQFLTDRIHIEQPPESTPAPDPLPVTHSATFIQRKRGVGEKTPSFSDDDPIDESDRSGVAWALKSVDDKLDEVERDSPRAVKAFSDAIGSDTGKAVRGTMVSAAKMTVEASMVAAKASLPVVGWAVRAGTKAILSSGDKEPRSKKKSKDKRKGKGKDGA